MRSLLGIAAAMAFGGTLAAACMEDERVDRAPVDGPVDELPPESCDAIDVDAPTKFSQCSKGSGNFGRWTTDPRGYPAYEYGVDQNVDDRALYFNTEGLERREHWGAFGNARVNGMFYNDGYVELVTQDRGVEYLNKFDASQKWYAGGFSYIDDGERTWSTAYKWRPDGAETRRRFGMGFGEAITRHRELEVRRATFAPAGEAPYLIDEIVITNLSSEPRTIAHYEFFDVGRRSIEINWIVSGDPLTAVPGTARQNRDALNGMFDEHVVYDADARSLVLRRAHEAGLEPAPREEPSATDYYPGDPFLMALVGDVDDTFTRDGAFFGDGDVAAPDAVAARASGEGVDSGPRGEELNGLGQPRLFVMKSNLSIEPAESQTLRFAYGYAPMGQPVSVDASLRDPEQDALLSYQRALEENLVYFATGDEPALHREMAWHSYQIEASVGQREYFEGPVVPQGSAYLYLHGADGAARDLGLFAIPLVYSHPELARAELELYMRITFAEDRRFSYAFQGHGMLDDALNFHHSPSDLCIFFLWAMGEYLGATGDLGFLDRKVPFWPREVEPDATAYDHVTGAVRHLFDVVGVGEHGLIRIGTGDWSDGIVVGAPDRDLAIEAGESVPNTQMAVAILPRMAEIIEARDPVLAAEIRDRVDGFRAALYEHAWSGDFYGRAYFGDGDLFKADSVDLEAQVWALVADSFPEDGDREKTIDIVHRELDMPSPTGAALTPDGMVWPAISGLLTDGYGRTRPDLAWHHYKRNTMFQRALTYPDQWYGIWSGPDGLNGPTGDRAGFAWHSAVTPMTDFPVQNNNQHAMPLYATLRLAGAEATARGMRIEPKVPDRHFSLVTRLVDIAQRPGDAEGPSTITVSYRPIGSVMRDVEIVAPLGHVIEAATLDGAPVEFDDDAASVTFTMLANLGKAYTMTIESRAEE